MFGTMLGCVRIDFHSTHRIENSVRAIAGMFLMFVHIYFTSLLAIMCWRASDGAQLH
jgi:hypothetical protein